MFIDPRQRLWLLWPTILANEWHTALMKYRISSDYLRDGPPRWDVSEVLHVTPGDEFKATVDRELDRLIGPSSSVDIAVRQQPERQQRVEKLRRDAADKLTRRLGWMTRAHPYVLDGTRLIVPLYSDGFSFSLMAISDDWGATWKTSTPLVGFGNIQPSLVRKKDGTLVAYMRDNGPAPKRLHVSRSRDRGETWSAVEDSSLPNPGSGAEVHGARERPLGARLQRSRAGALQPGGLALGRRRRDVAVDAAPRTRPAGAASRSATAGRVSLPVDHSGPGRHAARHLQLLHPAGHGDERRRRAPGPQGDQARALQRGVDSRATLTLGYAGTNFLEVSCLLHRRRSSHLTRCWFIGKGIAG